MPHPPTRRTFLKLAGAAASLALSGAARAQQVPARRPFEVSASLYAWDLHDEGIENILDNLQQMAAVNSVYLIGLMHPEKRPLTSPVFPHNPKRKTWQAEDSRIYWRPELKRYGRIKPRSSDFDWLNQTDWLNVLVEAARKRGLKTGAELSHTVLDAERGKGEFADCVQQNINGQSVGMHPICLNNPDGRQYVLNLFSDLTANYDVDYVQTCTLAFMPGGAESGGCFCDACMKAATASGIDLAKIKKALQANPKSQPELGQWEAFRRASVTSYYKFMHEGTHAIRPTIDLRLNDFSRNAQEWGIDHAMLKPHLDSVRVCDYSEQSGKPQAMADKRQWLSDVRGVLGKDFPLLSAIAVRPKATPELIREGVRIAIETGVDGITLGHYDGAEFPMLRAIREGLDAMKVSVPKSPAK